MQPYAQPSVALLEREVLPNNVRPVHYDLTIEPSFSDFTFKGKVVIDLEILQPTHTITANADELNIRNVSLLGTQQVHQASVSVEEKEERFTVSLLDASNKPVNLQPGAKVSLAIDYTGTMNDKMAGFYRSTYDDPSKSGQKKHMGVTQFEPTDARKAFPCWDEPALKATYDITLVIDKDLVGLSNMDEKEVKDLEGGRKKAIHFNRTPVMSTYLVAWIIGDLEHIEQKNKDGVLVRVFAPRGEAHRGRFALDVAARTLEFFSRYFDLAYPLPKSDLVAIPDFGSGAMENWGLVTYRTVYVLFDEKDSTLKTKQNVAYVVGHELAHQWFGNLVTMEWWSDLWLNEGFATWVGWLAADHLFPEWDIWTEFVLDDCQAGLSLDGLRSSHPIEVPVRKPSDITQIFDSISYSKGASVIRMLAEYLGEDTFKTGLRQYLRKHMWGNAKTADLWESLGKASGKPVAQIMDHWTKHVGYPVLSVQASSGACCKLHLRQNRFLATGDVKADEDATIWHVPLNVSTAADSFKNIKPEMLTEREGQIQVSDPLYKFNTLQTGFYRVEYPAGHLKSLAEKLGSLSASDRIGLISDSFSLSVAGRVHLTECLELSKQFESDSDYLVWGELSGRLAEVLSVWWEQPNDQQEALKALFRDLYSRVSRDVGFDPKSGEGDKRSLLRPLVIGMSGRVGDEEILKEARARFNRFSSGDASAIHPNLRGTIFAMVLRNSQDRSDWDAVMRVYREQSVADQRLAALRALGFIASREILQDTLELTLKSEIVRPQDVMYIFSSVSANPLGRRLSWQFVKQHWQTFHSRYFKGSISLLSRIISSTTENFSSEHDARDVESFFSDKDQTSIDRTIRQSCERIRLQAAWLERNRDSLSKWLLSSVSRLSKHL